MGTKGLMSSGFVAAILGFPRGLWRIFRRSNHRVLQESRDPTGDGAPETAATVGAPERATRRRISMGQARRTALAVLAEAEARRAAFADEEARRVAVWEDGS